MRWEGSDFASFSSLDLFNLPFPESSLFMVLDGNLLDHKRARFWMWACPKIFAALLGTSFQRVKGLVEQVLQQLIDQRHVARLRDGLVVH